MPFKRDGRVSRRQRSDHSRSLNAISIPLLISLPHGDVCSAVTAVQAGWVGALNTPKWQGDGGEDAAAAENRQQLQRLRVSH